MERMISRLMCSTDLPSANPAEGVSAIWSAEHVHRRASMCHHKIAQMTGTDSVEANMFSGVSVPKCYIKKPKSTFYPPVSLHRQPHVRTLAWLQFTYSRPHDNIMPSTISISGTISVLILLQSTLSLASPTTYNASVSASILPSLRASGW